MKKIFISIAIGAFSTLAMAKFVAFIPNEAGSKYTIVPMPVDCTGRATTDRNALIAKIDAGEDVTDFDTQCITDFSELFSAYRDGANQDLILKFNQDIGSWDVSSGTNFKSMFDHAAAFNQNIGSWDVSSGTNFEGMFRYAAAFNQNIGSWDVSSGTNFRSMFDNAAAFNQNIGAWDVSSGAYFSNMFNNAVAFNQDIGAWDVSSGTYFRGMLSGASSFNKDIHLWDVENATSYSDFRSYSQLTNDNTPFKFGGSDQDSDGDGVSDHTEVYNETDPLDPASL